MEKLTPKLTYMSINRNTNAFHLDDLDLGFILYFYCYEFVRGGVAHGVVQIEQLHG